MFQNRVVLPIDGESLLNAYVQVSGADMSWRQGPRNMGELPGVRFLLFGGARALNKRDG
jgi:hypothetical protein